MNRVRAGLVALAGVAMVGTGVLLPAGPASAKTVTVTGDLLDTCPDSGVTVPYKADRCKFVPESQESFQSDFHVPQNDEYAWNCTTAAQDHQYQITDVVDESNTFGISGGPKFKLGDAIEIGVEASYGHVWNKGNWTWNGDTHHVQPGNVGWLELSTEMLKVNGHWQINYGDRVKTSDDGDAHYEWYVGGSVTDDKDAGTHNVTFKERPMTDEEKNRVCGDNGQGPGEGSPGLRREVVNMVITQDAAGNVRK
ncbi:hypothetical protein GCM10023196_100730 [Actinoallomurus vinaceus]|uniref:Secreted protein n=1 Tax=Actinoallomurus vinaceus TaxID=1080074 RepID=A0ABP8UV64_9ACTN